MNEQEDSSQESNQRIIEARNLKEYKRALSELASGNRSEAIQILQQLLNSSLLKPIQKSTPQSPSLILKYVVLKNLAEIHDTSNEPELALLYADRALELDSSDPMLLFLVGKLSARLMKLDKARHALEKSLELTSFNGNSGYLPSANVLMDVLFVSNDFTSLNILVVKCLDDYIVKKRRTPITGKAALLRVHILELIGGNENEIKKLKEEFSDDIEASECIKQLILIKQNQMQTEEDSKAARYKTRKVKISECSWKNVCEELLNRLSKSPPSYYVKLEFGSSTINPTINETTSSTNTSTISTYPTLKNPKPARKSQRISLKREEKRISEIDTIISRFDLQQKPQQEPDLAISIAPSITITPIPSERQNKLDAELRELEKFASDLIGYSIEAISFQFLETLFSSSAVIWNPELKMSALNLHNEVSKHICSPVGNYYLSLAEVIVDGILSNEKVTECKKELGLANHFLSQFVSSFGTQDDRIATRVLWVKFRMAVIERNHEASAMFLSACDKSIGDSEILLPYCSIDSTLNSRTIQLKLCSQTPTIEGKTKATLPSHIISSLLPLGDFDLETAQSLISSSSQVVTDKSAPQRIKKLQALEKAFSLVKDEQKSIECITELLSELDPKIRNDSDVLLHIFQKIQSKTEKLDSDGSAKLLFQISSKLRVIDSLLPTKVSDIFSEEILLFEGFLALLNAYSLTKNPRSSDVLKFSFDVHNFFGKRGICMLKEGRLIKFILDSLMNFKIPETGEIDENFLQEELGIDLDVWENETSQCIACLTNIKLSKEVKPHCNYNNNNGNTEKLIGNKELLSQIFVFLFETLSQSRPKTDLLSLIDDLLKTFTFPSDSIPYKDFVNAVISGKLPLSISPPEISLAPKAISLQDFTAKHLFGIVSQLRDARKLEEETPNLDFLINDLGLNPNRLQSWYILGKFFRNNLFEIVDKFDGVVKTVEQKDEIIKCSNKILACFSQVLRIDDQDDGIVVSEMGFIEFWKSRLLRKLLDSSIIEKTMNEAKKWFTKAVEINPNQWVWTLMLGRTIERKKCDVNTLESAYTLYKHAIDLSKKNQSESLFALHSSRLKHVAIENSSLISDELLLLLERFNYSSHSTNQQQQQQQQQQQSKEERIKNVIEDSVNGLEHAVSSFKWHHKACTQLAKFYLTRITPPNAIKASEKLTLLVRPLARQVFSINVKQPEAMSEELLIEPGESSTYKRKTVRLYVDALTKTNTHETLSTILGRLEEDNNLSDIADICWFSLCSIIDRQCTKLMSEMSSIVNLNDGKLVPMRSEAEMLLHEAFETYNKREKHNTQASNVVSPSVLLIKAYTTLLRLSGNPPPMKPITEEDALSECNARWSVSLSFPKKRGHSSMSSSQQTTTSQPSQKKQDTQ